MSETKIAITDLGDGNLSITRLTRDGLPGAPINLADPDIICDPYSIYKKLRAISPICRSEWLFGGAWIFLDYHDVSTLFRDTDHLSNAKSRGIIDDLPEQERGQFERLVELHSRWLVFYDPPKHTRLRKLMAKGFTPQVRTKLDTFIKQRVENLISSFQGKEQIDVLYDYAQHIPLTVIAELLGIEKKDWPFFSRCISDIASYMGLEKPRLDVMAKAQQSLIEFEKYFQDVIAKRRRNLIADDLLSLLIVAEEHGDMLTTEELFAQCAFLSFTGNETTKNLISNSIYTLFRHPSQRLLLRNDPSIIDQAIEEVLRFECPVQFIGRLVKEDFSYKSARLRKGEYAILMIGAANRDPAQFSEPDKLDITRKEVRHISFGEGIHACLGQMLARLEAGIAVSAFLSSFPNSKLESDEGVKWKNNPGLRGLEYLFVKLQ